MSVADHSPSTEADTTTPLVAYILYLVGPANGLTILIAVILAYAKRPGADPLAASHYDWIIRTFWLSIGWLLVGALLFLVGIPLAWLGVGFLMIGAGLIIWSLIAVWAIVRCVLGLMYLSRGQPYLRPAALLF